MSVAQRSKSLAQLASAPGLRATARACSWTADRFFEEIPTLFFRSLLGYVSHRQHAAPRKRARAQLSVEALEGRALLSRFVVDRLSDLGEGAGLTGDLRYCITQANSLPGDDTITFEVTGTIQLTRALSNLSSNIDVQGPGIDLLAVRRNTGSLYRIFTVDSGATIFLSGLTITRGSVGEPERGGGIFNQGTLTLNNVTVSDNHVYSPSYNPSRGAGIANSGTLTLNNTTVSGNEGNGCWGGGIFNGGMLTVESRCEQ